MSMGAGALSEGAVHPYMQVSARAAARWRGVLPIAFNQYRDMVSKGLTSIFDFASYPVKSVG